MNSRSAGERPAGRLLLVFAHPDDEAFFAAGTVAKHVAAGGEAVLACATRGEQGSQPKVPVCPQPELGRVRARELADSCREMGVKGLEFLGYEDGRLGEADVAEATERIARLIEQVRPDAVVSFGPDGIYGHPDHVAASVLTTAAFDSVFGDAAGAKTATAPAPRGPRLWYVALPSVFWRYRPTEWAVSADPAAGASPEDLLRAGRHPVVEGVPEAVIDIGAFVERKIRALLCHRSQRHNVERAFGSLVDLDSAGLASRDATALLGREYFSLARGPRPKFILVGSLLDPGT
ncbi:MAG: PIG-L family deacetylase [Bacillota bacterium]|nr:MAG: PIG-L family deacetylase [Bacillota bacterium]